MPSFDALRQPWIPVEKIDGTIREYGILEVLRQANQLRSLVDSSPVFLYGMYRLLIAFLTDALRPQTMDDLFDIYETGSFPMERIDEYVGICEANGPCFDIFDEKRPFLQSAYDPKIDKDLTKLENLKSIAELAFDLPTGTKLTFFDHRQQFEHAFSPSVCTRALCSVNVFSVSGGSGYSPGINGASPWYLIIRGANLFETLLFNIWLPVLEIPFDNPPIAWRNFNPVLPKQKVNMTSYLYGLTWQARRILLVPSDSGYCSYSGEFCNITVSRICFQQGWGFEGQNLWIDPFVPRQSTKTGFAPIKVDDGRATWRYVAPLALSKTIVRKGSNEVIVLRPEIMNQFVNHWMEVLNSLGRRDSDLTLESFGLSSKPGEAKIIGWLHDVSTLPIGVIKNPTKADVFASEVQIVEEIFQTIKTYLGNQKKRKDKKHEEANLVSGKFIQSIEMQYFSEINKLLYSVLSEDLARVEDNHEGWRVEAIKNWRKEIKVLSLRIFDYAIKNSGRKANDIKRCVEIRSEFKRKLYSMLATKEVNSNG